jgi:predicted Holliday junction resolvase-like endonuclease
MNITVPSLIIAALVVALLVLFIRYLSAVKDISQLSGEMQQLARDQFDEWREEECESIRSLQKGVAEREAAALLQQWKQESELTIRTDAIQRSQSVIVGKVTEHLVPYLSGFEYNPKDARFIGSPIDLVVFDGLDEGDLQEIVFVEVKTGASASLSKRERQIRDAISGGRIKWVEMRIDREAS